MLSTSRVRLFAFALGLVALMAACQVETQVTIALEDDGSGQVEVALGLDEDALTHVPDPEGNGDGPEANLLDLVRTADLEAAGWELQGPEESEGMTWLQITKPFGTPEEATEILTELAPASVLSDLEVSRSTSFGTDSYEFTGTADLSGGLEAVGDDGLAELLDGNPLGESPEAMEERFGEPLGEMFQLVIQADLPDGVSEDWSPELAGSAVDMEAKSTVYNTPALVLAGLAVAAVLGLVGLFVVRTLRSARRGS